MRVIVTAGGTGGHIYPAIAIIDKILENEPDSEILYIGTHNRMEKDIVPKHDINYFSLKVTGFKRSLSFSNFKTIINFFKAIKQSKKVIKDFNPDIVIGVGGYVTAPVIYSAKKLGYKTIIHEQNSIPGLANKFLSKYADVIAISFKNSEVYFPVRKVIYTGNPCGEVALTRPPFEKKTFGLTSHKKLVLIVLGSLGSSVISEKMEKMLSLFNNKEYEVLYITGKDYYDDFIKNKKFSKNIKVVPYIDNLSSVMRVCDLIISRAGATTISEITAIGLPSILIPSPYVANNHQMKNALELANNDAAIIIKEQDLEGDILVRTVDSLINNEHKLKDMSDNAKKLGVTDSTTQIYELIKNMII